MGDVHRIETGVLNKGLPAACRAVPLGTPTWVVARGPAVHLRAPTWLVARGPMLPGTPALSTRGLWPLAPD